MTKKLIIAGALTLGLSVITLMAEPANANYYDCNEKLQAGTPHPSECHYYLAPPQRTSSTPTRQRRRTESSGVTPSSRRRNHVVVDSTPSSRHRAHVATDSSRHRVNVITKIGRNYSDLEEARNRNDAIVVNDPNNYSKKYEVKNARRYCIRDYCYIVYDYCYDLSHCEEKVQRVPRSNYESDWRTQLQDYLDEYFKRRPQQPCNPYGQNPGKCIYRGFHFGGYHNGYWHN